MVAAHLLHDCPILVSPGEAWRTFTGTFGYSKRTQSCSNHSDGDIYQRQKRNRGVIKDHLKVFKTTVAAEILIHLGELQPKMDNALIKL